MIRLEHIHKAFGDLSVLRDFSLELEPGERFVLLGPSGCGKTTLLRLIAGFEMPDAGAIYIEGQNVGALPVERRPVGFIFQRHALFPHKTVYDNIAVGPRVRGMDEAEIERRVGELLEITRLAAKRHAWPAQLSGGEAQRVALARAVINRPKLLLLDEPLSALDESLRQNLREELMEMQQAFGITFLFVTHDREEAMTLAHRMSVLHAGRPLQVGASETLYRRPQHPVVAGFLGEINRLHGVVASVSGLQVTLRLTGEGALTGVAQTPLKPGDSAMACIRPEHWQVLAPDTRTPDENPLAGTVRTVSFLGSRLRLSIELTGGDVVHALCSHAPETGRLTPGTRVSLACSSEEVMVFSGETA